MAELNDLFADATETTDTFTEQVEGGNEGVSEEEPMATEEPEVSAEGTEEVSSDEQEQFDENSVEYWKQKVEQLEQERRMLQSKKDREIWEMQQKLKELEQRISGKQEESEEPSEAINYEELRELFYEDPVAAVEKIVQAKAQEIVEQALPKVSQKQLTAKQKELTAEWQRQLEYLANLEDYKDAFTNENHPLAEPMREFVLKNRDRYLQEGKKTLVIDALNYAKKKVKLKREGTNKKASSVVSRRASKPTPSTPQNTKPTVNDLFAGDDDIL